MSSVPLVYRLAVRSLRRAAPLLGFGTSKLARGIAGRRHAHERLAAWGREQRDPSRPSAWFHAPSAGESLQAEEVMRALRERRPSLQVVFTHFSPSAEPFARRMDADVVEYLPWDVADCVSCALDDARPDLLVFTKTEVWPVLVDQAVARGVPVALVAASVPPRAGRRRPTARRLLRSTWSRLALACAASDEDAAGLVELGVADAAIHVTGDPAVDSAVRRAAAHGAEDRAVAALEEPAVPTLVAGSTWPADEDELVPALDAVRRQVPSLRVVVAPHEPTEARVEEVLNRLERHGWSASPLSAIERAGPAAPRTGFVVDRVGVLATLYGLARVAYVGGGFGRHGLHSVLEPAAAGVPVAFGPEHDAARHAAGLIAAGGAQSVSGARELAALLVEWLTDDEKRKHTVAGASAYIGEHGGAAARTAALLDPLLPDRHE